VKDARDGWARGYTATSFSHSRGVWETVQEGEGEEQRQRYSLGHVLRGSVSRLRSLPFSWPRLQIRWIGIRRQGSLFFLLAHNLDFLLSIVIKVLNIMKSWLLISWQITYQCRPNCSRVMVHFLKPCWSQFLSFKLQI